MTTLPTPAIRRKWTPGLQLHPLTGNRRGTWAVRVSGNWRLTFRFEDGEAVDVNFLEAYVLVDSNCC